MDAEVAVVGGGVVGSATALALARRGASVILLEAEPELALGASGTNSGIVHTGFDSTPGELETKLILRAAALREELASALELPIRRCGAELRPADSAQRDTVATLAARAKHNGVEAGLREDGTLAVPGEAITDPVVFALALAGAARRPGAEIRTGFRVEALRRSPGSITLSDAGGESVAVRIVVNCAGLRADEVAALVGDDSFAIYPRKGEFLVYEPPPGEALRQILLPVPSAGTKGVLVFPTLDGKVVAGPTAVDLDDKDDWTVRPEAPAEILARAAEMLPWLEGAEPVASYAGLRPAGVAGVNYLIAPSPAAPELINVAAIRSTGLTASPAIGEHVAGLVAKSGLALRDPEPLEPPADAPEPGEWWRRTAGWRAREREGVR